MNYGRNINSRHHNKTKSETGIKQDRDAVLFAVTKFPNKNKIKSRLSNKIGTEKAFNLYKSFLQDIAAEHSRNKEYDFYFSVNSTNKKKRFSRISNCNEVIEIKSKILNEHLLNTIKIGLKKYRKVIILAGDVPQIRKELVLRAIRALNSKDLVIGPTVDGGYYLIGMKQPVNLFSKIRMGNKKVFAKTISLAKRKKLQVTVLEKNIDIDTFADLIRFKKEENSTAAKKTLREINHILNKRCKGDNRRNTNRANHYL